MFTFLRNVKSHILFVVCFFSGVFPFNSRAALDITQEQAINFGNLLSGTAGGTLTMTGDVNGALSVGAPTGTVTNYGGQIIGRYKLSGAKNANTQVLITIQNPAPNMSNGGGGTASVNYKLSYDTDSNPYQEQFRMNQSANTYTFYVVGTITLGANQASGNYSGTYTITCRCVSQCPSAIGTCND